VDRPSVLVVWPIAGAGRRRTRRTGSLVRRFGKGIRSFMPF